MTCEKRFLFFFSATFTCYISLSFGVEIYKNDKIGDFQAFVSSEEFILIAGKKGIIKLGKNAMAETRHILMEGVWNVLIDKNTSNIIICSKVKGQNSYSSCSKFRYNLQTPGDPMSEYFATSTTDFPIAVEGKLSNEPGIIMAGGSLRNPYGTSFAVYSLRLDKLDEFPHAAFRVKFRENIKNRLISKAILTNDDFIYFLYNVYQSDTFIVSKLGKMCSTHRDANSEYLTSYEDIPVNCRHNNISYNQIENGIVVNATIVITFRNGNSSAVCRYNFIDIADHFRISRINRLKCEQESTFQTLYMYFKPDFMENWSTNTCINEENKTCPQQMVCGEILSDFCNTALYHTIEGNIPLTKEAVFNLPEAVIHTFTTDGTVVLAGTGGGEVLKFDVSSLDNFTVIGTYIIKEKPTILDVQVTDGMVYILTDQMLQRLRIDDCSFDSTCPVVVTGSGCTGIYGVDTVIYCLFTLCVYLLFNYT